MPSMIDAPRSAPATMSRGAIQQRSPRDSSHAHAASATVLSFDEWLMKMSWAMAPTF